jgi:hypothetical protein
MCTYAPNGKDAFKDIQNVWKMKLTSDNMKGLQSTRLFMKKTEKVRYIRKKKREMNEFPAFCLFCFIPKFKKTK